MALRIDAARYALALGLLLATGCSASSGEAGCESDADCAAGERCLSSSCRANPGPSGPVCGDGIVQPERGESCDLGSENSDQGYCTTGCDSTSCGDGLVQEGRGESCDEGDDNTELFGSCTTFCQEAACGDGVVGPGEWCDDGGGNNDPAGPCTSICQEAACGDGIRQHGESCDGEPSCLADCHWASACGIRALSDGAATVLVLREDGVLLGAGANGAARALGLDAGIATQPSLAPILPGVALVEVQALDAGGAGLGPGGTLVTFGSDAFGERGDGPGAPEEVSTELAGPSLVRLEARGATVLGLDAEGRLWGFGDDTGGVLRVPPAEAALCGSRPCVEAPVELFPGDPQWRFLDLSLGYQHVLALRTDGTLWGWGRNDECQLGCTDEELASRPTFTDAGFSGLPAVVEREPRRLLAEEGSVLFLAGGTTTHLVDRKGRIAILGVNYLVSLGTIHVDREYRAVPGRLVVNDAITGIAVKPRQLVYGMDAHVLLRTASGKLNGWGRNDYNQATTTFDYFTVLVQPMDLPDGVSASAVSAGYGFNHLISTDGHLYTIGANASGQLGIGTLVDAREWTQVDVCP